MNHTSAISDRIVSLGTRSYNQRLETLSGKSVTVQKLRRLNKDLDDLYEILYARFNSISEAEIIELTPVLTELLKSIKALHTSFRKSSSLLKMDNEILKLGMNYSALYEINSDLHNFRMPSNEDKELRELLNKVSVLMHKIS